MKLMKKGMALLLILAMAMCMVACGSKDKLAGKWSGKDVDDNGQETEYSQTATFDFDGAGKLKYENGYGISLEGTYKIDGDKVSMIGLWDEDKTYVFAIDGDSLTLRRTGDDILSPQYNLSK